MKYISKNALAEIENIIDIAVGVGNKILKGVKSDGTVIAEMIAVETARDRTVLDKIVDRIVVVVVDNIGVDFDIDIGDRHQRHHGLHSGFEVESMILGIVNRVVNTEQSLH